MAVVTKDWLNRTDLLMPSTPSTRLGKPHQLSEHGDRNVIQSRPQEFQNLNETISGVSA